MHRPAMIAFEIILAVGLPVDRAVAVLRHEIMLLFERVVGRHVVDRAEPFDQARAAALHPAGRRGRAIPRRRSHRGPRRPDRKPRRSRNRAPCSSVRRAYSSSCDRGRRRACRTGRSPSLEKLRAAMPADIVEGANLSRVVAHRENGIARDGSRHIVAGLAQRARTRKTASNSWRKSPAAPARTARDRDSPGKAASSRSRLWSFASWSRTPSQVGMQA